MKRRKKLWNLSGKTIFISSLSILIFLQLRCLTPTDVPPSGTYNVKIHVQNSREESLKSIPIEMFSGKTASSDQRLELQYTNDQGDVLFKPVIQSLGANFLFQIGNDNTGKVRLNVFLKGKDTLIVVTLDLKDIPCNTNRSDTLRISDICAPLPNGQIFSDSAQISLSSGCTVPLTISFIPLHDPSKLDIFVFDTDGKRVEGNGFILPPKGSFTIRAVATPLQEGTIAKSFTLTGAGKDSSELKLTVTVIVTSVSCSNNDCRDTTLTLLFKNILIDTSSEGSIQKLDFLKNRSSVDRIDRIVVRPNKSDIFSLLDSVQSVVKPNESQSLRIRFRPKTDQAVLDTLVIESVLNDTTLKCYTVIKLEGQGCGPRCEPRLWGLVQQGATPDDFVVNTKVLQDEYNSNGYIYFSNTGNCGSVKLSFDTTNLNLYPGYYCNESIERILKPGESNFFRSNFYARDNAVWPNGHGQPAKINHQYVMRMNGCGNEKRLQINMTVDTIPIQHTRCIYQWSDNGNFGYNFRPIETKGVEVYDPNALSGPSSDIVLKEIVENVSATVLVRTGWKFVKSDVSESDFVFNQVTRWSEYHNITKGTFNITPAALAIRSVYSIKIDRDGRYSYAILRVREISRDPDNKHKICFDVMYPMIKE